MAPCRPIRAVVAVATALACASPGDARADSPAPSSPIETPPPPTPAPVVTEVTVQGDRPDPGQTTLRGGTVRQLPGAFGDAFRAIEAFPGVTPMASGLPYFFIRGAPPGKKST